MPGPCWEGGATTPAAPRHRRPPRPPGSVGPRAFLTAPALTAPAPTPIPSLEVTRPSSLMLQVTPVMHSFWDLPEGPEQLADMINFFKNVSLAGALLFYLGAKPGRAARR